VDGNALRRAMNKKENLKYVVSAWAESNNLVLGPLKVTDKSNEITAVPELLRVLECHRSDQNVPPRVESKCTTRWVEVLGFQDRIFKRSVCWHVRDGFVRVYLV
jgi:hypothetical protein